MRHVDREWNDFGDNKSGARGRGAGSVPLHPNRRREPGRESERTGIERGLRGASIGVWHRLTRPLCDDEGAGNARVGERKREVSCAAL